MNIHMKDQQRKIKGEKSMNIMQNTNVELQELLEIINELGILKAEIEWDHSLEYQILLDRVIEILKEGV